MSKKALYLLGIAVTIILGTILYAKFCCKCCEKMPSDDNTKMVQAPVSKPDFVPFALNGSGIEYQTHDNLKFLKNNAAFVTPISDSVSIGIDKLKAFLDANPKQKIVIKGYALTDETNSTAFENLGLARADEIKKYFISKGLSANQFETKGEIINEWKTKADTLLGPAEYSFEAIEAETASGDEWSTLKDKINADPLTLHFGTNKSAENLNSIEKQKVAAIAKYTQHVKDAVVLVVGHSDNSGNRESNTVLAQKRAEFTKKYLSKNGIDSSRIETQSKGPDEPIGDNATAEGRASNRRTVITIK